MSRNNSSQCQLFQLHIDAYLDHELEPARRAELEAHTEHCVACRQELAFAERLHRAVVSLPILDCPDHALEPVDRLYSAGSEAARRRENGFWSSLAAAVTRMPGPVRLGVPVAVAVLLMLNLGSGLFSSGPGEPATEQAVSTPATPAYTEAEIVRALQDLELALDYLSQISERTEVLIEDRFVRQQIQDSINASLNTDVRPDAADNNGPI